MSLEKNELCERDIDIPRHRLCPTSYWGFQLVTECDRER